MDITKCKDTGTLTIESEHVIVTCKKDNNSLLYDVEVDHKHADYPIQLEDVSLEDALDMADLTYDYDDDIQLGLYLEYKG